MNEMLNVFLIPWFVWSLFFVRMGCKFGFSNVLLIWFCDDFICHFVRFLWYFSMWVWWIFIDLVCCQIWCLIMFWFCHQISVFSNIFGMMLFKVMYFIMFDDLSYHCDLPIGRLESSQVLFSPFVICRGRSFVWILSLTKILCYLFDHLFDHCDIPIGSLASQKWYIFLL